MRFLRRRGVARIDPEELRRQSRGWAGALRDGMGVVMPLSPSDVYSALEAVMRHGVTPEGVRANALGDDRYLITTVPSE